MTWKKKQNQNTTNLKQTNIEDSHTFRVRFQTPEKETHLSSNPSVSIFLKKRKSLLEFQVRRVVSGQKEEPPQLHHILIGIMIVD